ncbi:MAG: LuxR C-terminal-related transcriptional regulator [Candidatus Promineifilaceae bacterium]
MADNFSLTEILDKKVNQLSGGQKQMIALGSILAMKPSILLLDDYHLLEAPAIDALLSYLVDHLPPSLHLAITTREDPALPLARLRARGQLNELRAADLRFSRQETAVFLNEAMGLHLRTGDVAALEARTEGWIAGLQLAAISLKDQADAHAFIQNFSSSHRYVLDYLVEEVLERQSAAVQDFLLQTAVLERFCDALCEAVLGAPAGSARETLAYLDRANLFLIGLDNERRWYRYHHLFADLLRRRLLRHAGLPAVSALHGRAANWFESQNLALEAFQHAAAAGDVPYAARLAAGDGMPLHFRGAAAPVLHWLQELPPAELDSRPSLWVLYAHVLYTAGYGSRVPQALAAAESALPAEPVTEIDCDLAGQIAAMRASLAAHDRNVPAMLAHAQRALDLLEPDNLPLRTMVTRIMALAYQFQGERAAACQAYETAMAASAASGNTHIELLAATGLGIMQERDLLPAAAEASYRRVLALAGDRPAACEATFGLGRLAYQRNELRAAAEQVRHAAVLARQIEAIDSDVAAEIFLVRIIMALGDEEGAAGLLASLESAVYRGGYDYRKPALAAEIVRLRLRQGDISGAARALEAFDLPRSRARIHLARGEALEALAALEPACAEARLRSWPDELLAALLLQALAYEALGERDMAAARLEEALALAAPAGQLRLFLDEGPVMAGLLARVRKQTGYGRFAGDLLAAFPGVPADVPAQGGLADPLSPRELEVLALVAEGLTNRQISERLFLALSTVKGHNSLIFDKLGVRSRTQAVARARELGLLQQ